MVLNVAFAPLKDSFKRLFSGQNECNLFIISANSGTVPKVILFYRKKHLTLG